MSTDKQDITIILTISLLLDRTATVDEAIEMLEKYDMHTAHNCHNTSLLMM